MTAPPRGRLIALEGIDGSGKSTQARRLATALGADLTAEPGATALGRRLRALLLEPGGPARNGRAEALLMAADRAQHVDEVVAPVVAIGGWMVTDRYSGSTLAYQGFGRGVDLGALSQIVEFAAAGTEADLSVLIDVAPEVARRRRSVTSPDRIEGSDVEFHRRVRDGYRAMAAADAGHWVVVDGAADEEAVAVHIHDVVVARLGAPPGGGR